MSRGNHFMIDKFFRRSKVAGQAFGGALLQVACVVHAELNGLLVGPVFCGMRTEPTRCRTVTVLATHSIAWFKCLGLLLWGDRKSTRLNSSHLGSSYAVFCLNR